MSEAEKKLLRTWVFMSLTFKINSFSSKSQQVLSLRRPNYPRIYGSTVIVVRYTHGPSVFRGKNDSNFAYPIIILHIEVMLATDLGIYGYFFFSLVRHVL